MSTPVDPTAAVHLLTGARVDTTDSAGCAELLGTAKGLRGWLDSVEARITSRVTELHATAGGAPAADLHSKCSGVSAAEGKKRDRRSKTIETAPTFGDALAAGSVSAEHVDALANATSKLDDDVKAAVFDCESDLLDDASRMTPEQFARSVRELSRRLEHDHGIERNTRQRRETFLTRRLNPATGMIEGRFALHPELGNQIFNPIDREIASMIATGEQTGDPRFVNRTIDRNQLAAEALGTLVSGGHQQTRPTETEVLVIVDHTTAETGQLHHHSICETSNGAAIPPASIRRMMCEGRIVPIIVDADGNPFNRGREIRHANRNQRRALRAIYRTCAFGNCDVAFERCHIHHIVPWEHDGPTDLHNLIPLCSRHHHVIHEAGWTLHLAPDRTLTITQPDGQTFTVCHPDITQQRTSPPPSPPTVPPTGRRRQPAA